MYSILFVDDEPAITQALKRMLHSMRREWDMHFVLSGKDALCYMEDNPVDVIISDMRMPEMNGAELLDEVIKRYPNVIRIILSGQADQEAILKTIKPAHQFLTKPCDAETLRQTIKHTLALRSNLGNPALQDLVSKIESLPSLPSCYHEIMQILQKEEGSLKEVAEIIQNDVSMSMEILKYVNSSFFGLYKEVTSIRQAVSLLGINTIQTLVLSINVFSQFDKSKHYAIDIPELWEHSLLTGLLSKAIIADLGMDRNLQEDAFTLGLLHDIGILILATQIPEKYNEVYEEAKRSNLVLSEAEYQIFDTSHAEVAAYLIGLWGLSSNLITAISTHHFTKLIPNELTVLSIVMRSADVFSQELMQKNQGLRLEEFQPPLINNKTFSSNRERWEKLCTEIYRRDKNE